MCGEEVAESHSKSEWIRISGRLQIRVKGDDSRERYMTLDFCSVKCMRDYLSEWIEGLEKRGYPDGFEKWF